jgi:putative flippase GtrA
MTTSPGTEPAAPNVLRRLVNELIKFGAVGIVGLVVQFGTLPIWLDLLPATRASMAATLLAIGTNYIGYRYWVYRHADKRTRSREITLFLLFSGIGMVIQIGIVWALTSGLKMDDSVAVIGFNVIGIGTATMFRFWSYRTWVFRAVPQAAETPAVAVDAVGEAEQILAAAQVKRKRATSRQD